MTLAIDWPHDPGDPGSDHSRPWPHDPGEKVAPRPWRKRRPLAPCAWRPTTSAGHSSGQFARSTPRRSCVGCDRASFDAHLGSGRALA